MNHAEIKRHVGCAINTLIKRDSDLFFLDASEWAIAHRLAVYLEIEIAGWNVDCEYNRQGQSKDVKKMLSDVKVRPDIILHHRGQMEREHNLLVVEIKKCETGADLAKACEYTKPAEGDRKFQYQFGLALSLAQVPILKWFSDGRII